MNLIHPPNQKKQFPLCHNMNKNSTKKHLKLWVANNVYSVSLHSLRFQSFDIFPASFCLRVNKQTQIEAQHNFSGYFFAAHLLSIVFPLLLSVCKIFIHSVVHCVCYTEWFRCILFDKNNAQANM